MDNNEIDHLLSGQSASLKKLHKIVKETLKSEELIINNLLHPPYESITQSQKVADKVAKFGGSWKFIFFFLSFLIFWIIFNIVAIQKYKFDPFPFIFMNLILSCIAALQAPVIMMSQNRQNEKDRVRSENDYLINLKAELEIRSLHQKMDLLLEEQIKTLFESQAKQFTLLKNLHEKIDVLSKK